MDRREDGLTSPPLKMNGGLFFNHNSDSKCIVEHENESSNDQSHNSTLIKESPAKRYDANFAY